jgi:hypothetical protein
LGRNAAQLFQLTLHVLHATENLQKLAIGGEPPSLYRSEYGSIVQIVSARQPHPMTAVFGAESERSTDSVRVDPKDRVSVGFAKHLIATNHEIAARVRRQ